MAIRRGHYASRASVDYHTAMGIPASGDIRVGVLGTAAGQSTSDKDEILAQLHDKILLC